ncbi:hypothetical protein [Streptomyces sp. EN27]|uniref:hypothetical protein n=1 Tax=Streptomyces sp. EN27 TaxID=211464 RepID=UPI00099FBEE6
MNTFLNYLVVAALFALVLAPAVLGSARERRIDRQLRDAERGEPPVRRRADRGRPAPAVPSPHPGDPAQCPLLS